MERLDTYATEDEIVKAKELLHDAQTTPVIAIDSAHALRGGMSGDAWKRVHDYIERIAKDHDLPEISGQYGLDCENGQFLK